MDSFSLTYSLERTQDRERRGLCSRLTFPFVSALRLQIPSEFWPLILLSTEAGTRSSLKFLPVLKNDEFLYFTSEKCQKMKSYDSKMAKPNSLLSWPLREGIKEITKWYAGWAGRRRQNNCNGERPTEKKWGMADVKKYQGRFHICVSSTHCSVYFGPAKIGNSFWKLFLYPNLTCYSGIASNLRIRKKGLKGKKLTHNQSYLWKTIILPTKHSTGTLGNNRVMSPTLVPPRMWSIQGWVLHY